MKDLDPTSVQRKKDHIEMAFEANLGISNIDDRFYYEPILNTHPDGNVNLHTEFVGKRMKAPIWVSSMTGGT
ncbi:MAG: isopentenyl-diphosphate delta-isomerase, partial [Bacteroidota bacterium]